MKSRYRRVNAARCKKCGQVLVSLRRHDFVQCGCGEYVDGGFDYSRRTTNLENLPLYWRAEE
jgi:ssDNA-binding Zn-finger/Zn-ribbon topoisomerase 1